MSVYFFYVHWNLLCYIDVIQQQKHREYTVHGLCCYIDIIDYVTGIDIIYACRSVAPSPSRQPTAATRSVRALNYECLYVRTEKQARAAAYILTRCSSAGCLPLQMPPRAVCPSTGCPPGQSALGQSVPRGHSTLGQTVPS